MSETPKPPAHTPGPWVAESFDGEPVVTAPGVLTDIAYLQDKDDAAWADARLIAAAPDLLAACDEALAFVRHVLEFFAWDRFPNLDMSGAGLRDQLTRATTKARGGSRP